MIIHRKLFKMKHKILPTCLQGNYGNSLGEFSNTSYGVIGAERVNGGTAVEIHTNMATQSTLVPLTITEAIIGSSVTVV